MRPRPSTCLWIATVAAALGAAWLFLAPPQLGGKTEYAITFGVSMEPHLHRGDLVVLRTRAAYAVGDVVAYRSRLLHRDVLHRIIGIRDGLYTFKGDNNDFVDPEQPTARALVGEEWLRVPRVGAWLAQLRAPRNAATASGLVVLLLLAGGGAPAAARRRRRAAPAAERPAPRPAPAPELPAPAGVGAAPAVGIAVGAAGACALLAGALLGLAGFTHPTQRSVASTLYVQHGRFDYSAPVARGATYQGRQVRSGQPVYLELVRRLPVSFRYRLQAGRRGPLSGSASLAAVVHDDEGWRHRIVLAEPRRFDGAETVVRGTLDLARLRRLIAAFERQTGVHNTVYHVTLRAHVALRGTVASQRVATSFSSLLPLSLDAYRLTPTQPASLSHARSGVASHLRRTTLRAFGRTATVASVRRLAELLAAGGAVLLLLGGLVLRTGGRGHEAAEIRRRYDDWIVEVAPRERADVAERRVASMDALARLAEQYERLILHERRGDGDAFLVEEGGTVYAYVVRAWEPERRLAVAR